MLACPGAKTAGPCLTGQDVAFHRGTVWMDRVKKMNQMKSGLVGDVRGGRLGKALYDNL